MLRALPSPSQQQFSPPNTCISPEWIHQVFNLQDRTLRSHLVTYTYHVFANDLDRRIFGPRAEGVEKKQRAVNWFNFASWATFTVGGNIRHDNGPQRLKDLPAWLARVIEPSSITLRASREEFVGRALTFGESLPFSTSTLPYLALVDSLATSPDRPFRLSGSLRNRLKRLFHSDCQQEPIIADSHLDLIERSFDTFRLAHRAMSFTNGNIGTPLWSALILYANILLAIVEQLLVDGVVNDVVEFLPKSTMRSMSIRRATSDEQTRDGHNRFEDALTSAWAHFMTRHVLVLDLTSERLWVGRAIKERSEGVVGALEDLKVIEESIPAAHPEAHLFRDRLDSLGRLIDALGHSALSGQRAASDWRSFDDRARWALGLMNALQFDDRLLRPAYSDAQQAYLRNAVTAESDLGGLGRGAGLRRLEQPIMRRTRPKVQRPVPIPDWLSQQTAPAFEQPLVGAV
jgi:hypothetical protein